MELGNKVKQIFDTRHKEKEYKFNKEKYLKKRSEDYILNKEKYLKKRIWNWH